MLNLTFGEQVKIVLGRKGMTIKELAETIEERTGKKMSRQNLTQRLGRDNFQEQDMRMIADILGCRFQLSIMAGLEAEAQEAFPTAEELEKLERKKEKHELRHSREAADEEEDDYEDITRDVTIGELVDIWGQPQEEPIAGPMQAIEPKQQEDDLNRTESFEENVEQTERNAESAVSDELETEAAQDTIEQDMPSEKQEITGDINPYTGREYESNSVRMHPKRIGYVQVYDRAEHQWTDMTEWAFLGYQERKKALMGKDYDPPIYLD